MSEFANCDTKISKEHYISDGILKIIASGGGEFLVFGAPWVADAVGLPLSIKSQGANVLCRQHNSMLSPLDAIGIRYFETLKAINEEAHPDGDHTDPYKAYLFNGHDIERWALKALCGLLASGSAKSPNGLLRDWIPPRQWIEVLCGLIDMPDGMGLYFPTTRPLENISPRAGITPIGVGDKPMGAKVNLWDFEFLLWLDSVSTLNTRYPHGTSHVYRPGGLGFHSSDIHRFLIIEWNDNRTHAPLNLTAGPLRAATFP